MAYHHAPLQTAPAVADSRQQTTSASRCSSLSDEDYVQASRCPSMTLSATSSESATENETPPSSPSRESLKISEESFPAAYNKRFFIYEPESLLDAETPRASPYQRKDYMSPIPESIEDDAEDEADPHERTMHRKHGSHRARHHRREHSRRRGECIPVQQARPAPTHESEAKVSLKPMETSVHRSVNQNLQAPSRQENERGRLQRQCRPTRIDIPSVNTPNSIDTLPKATVGLGLGVSMLSPLQTPKASFQPCYSSGDSLFQETFPAMPFPETDSDFEPAPPSSFHKYNPSCQLRPVDMESPTSPIEALSPLMLSEGSATFVPALRIHLGASSDSGMDPISSMGAGAFLAIAASANTARNPVGKISDDRLHQARPPRAIPLKRCPRTFDFEKYAEQSLLEQCPSLYFNKALDKPETEDHNTMPWTSPDGEHREGPAEDATM